MGHGPFRREFVLLLPVGLLHQLPYGQLFERHAAGSSQLRFLGSFLHCDQPVYDLPEQHRQGYAGLRRGDRDDEGRGPFPARLLLLLPLPSVRTGLPVVRPDSRRGDRSRDDRPPHGRPEYRLHREGALGGCPDPADGHHGDRPRRFELDGSRHEGCRSGSAFARAALRRLAALQRCRHL